MRIEVEKEHVSVIGQDSPLVWAVKVWEMLQRFASEINAFADNVDERRVYKVRARFDIISVPKET